MNTEPVRDPHWSGRSDKDKVEVPKLDLDRFEHLMSIAGANYAEELLRRLRQDLESVQDLLSGSVTPPDWAVLRAQSHVLVALAGAVGAVQLQHMAETLNALAHGSDVLALNRLMPGLLDHLDALIVFVADRLNGFGG